MHFGQQQNLFLLITICWVQSSTAYRILGIFPHPGITHFYFFHPIMRGLADAGHDVTVISQFADPNPPKNYKDLLITGVPSLHNTVELEWFERTLPVSHFMEFFMLNSWGIDSCHNFLNSSAMVSVLSDKQKYDVIILEQFNNDCMMAVAWKLKAPVIGLSSCPLMPWHYERMGNPMSPSFIPALFMEHSEKMTISQRIANWLATNGLRFLYKTITNPATDSLVKTYLGDGIPPVSELVKQTSMMFVNQHYSFNGAKPLSPAVIELMGIHVKEPEPLDDEVQKFLDSADQGAIYVSWGSMVKTHTLPVEKREQILSVFATLKQKVLWKWANDSLPNKPSNVLTRKWMQQREILCHPNIRVFLTHGGSMGTAEALHCGVPTIITPFYGDQYLNGAAYENRGAGKILHYQDINADTLRETLAEVLHPKIQENAKKLSYSFRNRNQQPIDTAIWWVEHVAETGGAPLLKSHSIFMPAYAYYSLDAYATIIGFIISIFGLIWILMKVFERKSTIETKSKIN